MNRLFKKAVSLVLAVAVMLSLSCLAFAADLPAVNESNYLVCYPLSDSGRVDALDGSNHWIDPSDECRITAIDGNRVCVSYPVKNGRRSDWFSRDAFTTCEINWAACPTICAPGEVRTYKRSYGNDDVGHLDTNEECFVLTRMGNRTQLIYPIKNNKWKMAWVNTAEIYSDETSTTIYTIHTALDTNKVLDVWNYGSDDGTNIQIYTSHGGTNQQFAMIPKGDWYVIVNTATGKALDVTGGTAASQVNVQLYSVNFSDAQLWKFKSAGGKSYYVRNKLGYYLDVCGGSANDETNIWVYDKNKTEAQKFKFKESKNSPTTSVSESGSWYEERVGTVIANVSGYTTKLDGYNGIAGQCVWYVRNRGYEKLGTAGLTGIGGDAKTWFGSAQSKGLSTGSTPKANSIVCWSGGSYGHVAYVEYYDESSQTVYFTEANWGGKSSTNGQLKKLSFEDFMSRKSGYQGCIYLQ